MNILYIVHFGGNFVSDRNYFEIKKGREGKGGPGDVREWKGGAEGAE